MISEIICGNNDKIKGSNDITGGRTCTATAQACGSSEQVEHYPPRYSIICGVRGDEYAGYEGMNMRGTRG